MPTTIETVFVYVHQELGGNAIYSFESSHAAATAAGGGEASLVDLIGDGSEGSSPDIAANNLIQISLLEANIKGDFEVLEIENIELPYGTTIENRTSDKKVRFVNITAGAKLVDSAHTVNYITNDPLFLPAGQTANTNLPELKGSNTFHVTHNDTIALGHVAGFKLVEDSTDANGDPVFNTKPLTLSYKPNPDENGDTIAKVQSFKFFESQPVAGAAPEASTQVTERRVVLDTTQIPEDRPVNISFQSNTQERAVIEITSSRIFRPVAGQDQTIFPNGIQFDIQGNASDSDITLDFEDCLFKNELSGSEGQGLFQIKKPNARHLKLDFSDNTANTGNHFVFTNSNDKVVEILDNDENIVIVGTKAIELAHNSTFDMRNTFINPSKLNTTGQAQALAGNNTERDLNDLFYSQQLNITGKVTLQNLGDYDDDLTIVCDIDGTTSSDPELVFETPSGNPTLYDKVITFNRKNGSSASKVKINGGHTFVQRFKCDYFITTFEFTGVKTTFNIEENGTDYIPLLPGKTVTGADNFLTLNYTSSQSTINYKNDETIFGSNGIVNLQGSVSTINLTQSTTTKANFLKGTNDLTITSDGSRSNRTLQNLTVRDHNLTVSNLHISSTINVPAISNVRTITLDNCRVSSTNVINYNGSANAHTLALKNTFEYKNVESNNKIVQNGSNVSVTADNLAAILVVSASQFMSKPHYDLVGEIPSGKDSLEVQLPSAGVTYSSSTTPITKTQLDTAYSNVTKITDQGSDFTIRVNGMFFDLGAVNTTKTVSLESGHVAGSHETTYSDEYGIFKNISQATGVFTKRQNHSAYILDPPNDANKFSGTMSGAYFLYSAYTSASKTTSANIGSSANQGLFCSSSGKATFNGAGITGILNLYLLSYRDKISTNESFSFSNLSSQLDLYTLNTQNRSHSFSDQGITGDVELYASNTNPLNLAAARTFEPVIYGASFGTAELSKDANIVLKGANLFVNETLDVTAHNNATTGNSGKFVTVNSGLFILSGSKVNDGYTVAGQFDQTTKQGLVNGLDFLSAKNSNAKFIHLGKRRVKRNVASVDRTNPILNFCGCSSTGTVAKGANIKGYTAVARKDGVGNETLARPILEVTGGQFQANDELSMIINSDNYGSIYKSSNVDAGKHNFDGLKKLSIVANSDGGSNSCGLHVDSVGINSIEVDLDKCTDSRYPFMLEVTEAAQVDVTLKSSTDTNKYIFLKSNSAVMNVLCDSYYSSGYINIVNSVSEAHTLYSSYTVTSHPKYPLAATVATLSNITIANNQEKFSIITDIVSETKLNLTNKSGVCVNYVRKDAANLTLDLSKSLFANNDALLGNDNLESSSRTANPEYTLRNMSTEKLSSNSGTFKVNSAIKIIGMSDGASGAITLFKPPIANSTGGENPVVTVENAAFNVTPLTQNDFKHTFTSNQFVKWNLSSATNSLTILKPSSNLSTNKFVRQISEADNIVSGSFASSVVVSKDITHLDMSGMEKYFRNNANNKIELNTSVMNEFNFGSTDNDMIFDIKDLSTSSNKVEIQDFVMTGTASVNRATFTVHKNTTSGILISSNGVSEDIVFTIQGNSNSVETTNIKLDGNFKGLNNVSKDYLLTVGNFIMSGQLCYSLAHENNVSGVLLKTESTLTNDGTVKIETPTTNKFVGLILSGGHPVYSRNTASVGHGVFSNKTASQIDTAITSGSLSNLYIWTYSGASIKLKSDVLSATYGSNVSMSTTDISSFNTSLTGGSGTYANYWTNKLSNANANIYTLPNNKQSQHAVNSLSIVNSPNTFFAEKIEYQFVLTGNVTLSLGTYNYQDTNTVLQAVKHSIGYANANKNKTLVVGNSFGITHSNNQSDNVITPQFSLNKVTMKLTGSRTLFLDKNAAFAAVEANFENKPKITLTTDDKTKLSTGEKKYPITILTATNIATDLKTTISPYTEATTAVAEARDPPTTADLIFYTAHFKVDQTNVTLSVKDSLSNHYPSANGEIQWTFGALDKAACGGDKQYGDPIKTAPFNHTIGSANDLWTITTLNHSTELQLPLGNEFLPITQEIVHTFTVRFTPANPSYYYRVETGAGKDLIGSVNTIINNDSRQNQIDHTMGVTGAGAKEQAGGSVGTTLESRTIESDKDLAEIQAASVTAVTPDVKYGAHVAAQTGQQWYKLNEFDIDYTVTLRTHHKHSFDDLIGELAEYKSHLVTSSFRRPSIKKIHNPAWGDLDNSVKDQTANSNVSQNNDGGTDITNDLENYALRYAAMVRVGKDSAVPSSRKTNWHAYDVVSNQTMASELGDFFANQNNEYKESATETPTAFDYDFYVLTNNHESETGSNTFTWGYDTNYLTNDNYKLIGAGGGTRLKLLSHEYRNWTHNDTTGVMASSTAHVADGTQVDNMTVTRDSTLFRYRLVLDNPAEIRLRDVSAKLAHTGASVLTGSQQFDYEDETVQPTLTMSSSTNRGNLNNQADVDPVEQSIYTFRNSAGLSYNHTLRTANDEAEDSPLNLTNAVQELFLTPEMFPNVSSGLNELNLEFELNTTVNQQAEFTFVVKNKEDRVLTLADDERPQPQIKGNNAGVGIVNIDAATNKYSLIISDITDILVNSDDYIEVSLKFIEQDVTVTPINGNSTRLVEQQYNNLLRIRRNNGASVVLPEDAIINGLPVARTVSFLNFKNWTINEETRVVDGVSYNDLVFVQSGNVILRISSATS